MIKKILIVPALMASMLIGGCAVSTLDYDKLNDTEFVEVLDKDTAVMRADAALMVAFYFALIEDNGERAETAKFANEVAIAVKDATLNRNLTLDQIRAYAFELVSNGDDNHKALVGAIVNSVAVRVEDKLDVRFLPGTDRRSEAARAFIVAAADGIIDATHANVSSSPVPVPAKLPR